MILAGGFGTRFGGPKQFMEVGPNGECLLHYALADAWAAGFRDFVLLTRKEIEERARETVFPRLAPEVRPRMVFQETPGGKARGTAHAVLSCRGQVTGQFAVCNADDFYGPATYGLLAQMLQNNADAGARAVMVPFEVRNTLSENGGGSRAKVEGEEGRVHRLTELRDVLRGADGVIRGRTEEGVEMTLDEKTPVSMNVFGFDDSIFDAIQAYADMVDAESPGREIGLPQFLNGEIEAKRMTLRFSTTPERWFGLTFPEDLEEVRANLASRGPAF